MALIDDVIAKQTKFLKGFHKDKDIVFESRFVRYKDKYVEDYLVCDEYNLIEPFLGIWEKIKEELGGGKGNELKKKFRAVKSSAALCVNNFAPLKKRSVNFSFLGYTGFCETKTQFEQELQTGLDGHSPNLDFYLENDKTIIGIESKFTEHFGRKRPNHRTQDRQTKELRNNLEPYRDRKTLDYLPEGFHGKIIDHYYGDDELKYLDIAQLIKHSIGLLKKCNKKKAVLVYLYWEPKAVISKRSEKLFAKHQEEIEKFGEKMKLFESDIKFIPLSYPEFWKMYENDPLLKEHIGRVRERYEFAI
jgi:hypothetical protein